MRPTLSDILAAKRRELISVRERHSEFEVAARGMATPPRWVSAFGGADVAVIGEVKRRSPSAGAIAHDLDPASHARSYVAGGARAISVLTDGTFFGGSLLDLQAVREAVRVPVLRKDFILDPVQLYEARAAGASAVLLIVRTLDSVRLQELAALARELELDTLIEVHGASELAAAIRADPDTVGVNSRDLETFEVDVPGMEIVLREIPSGVTAVAESGLHDRGDIERVASWGADAALVGTAIARAQDPEKAVRALTGVPRTRRAVA